MNEADRRWRLVLGEEAAEALDAPLQGPDGARDAVLSKLYEPRDRTGGLGRSAPVLARWLGDIRTYFPTPVVRVLQHDAMERLGLRQLLLEPETLEALEPDVNLAAAIVSLSQVIPDRSRHTAREVVRRVTADLERRLATRTRAAVRGALARAARSRRPRPGDIDLGRTLHANLHHYRPEIGTVIPERLVGYGRRQEAVQRHVILAVDQSASMAESVVHAGVCASVLAGLPSLSTRLIVFDTAVADLTDLLDDPVDVLFGTQLGGGTDIGQALAYCRGLVTRPAQTVLVLISDLFDGGPPEIAVRRISEMVASEVTVVVLLALNDQGAPAYDHAMAEELARVGVVCLACTPDLFPELMAAAIERRDLGSWAAERGLVTAAG